METWSGLVCGRTHGSMQSWESKLRTQRSLEQEQSSNSNKNCGASHQAATQESTVRTVAETQQKCQPRGSYHVCIANQRWGTNKPSCQREGQEKLKKRIRLENNSGSLWQGHIRFSKNVDSTLPQHTRNTMKLFKKSQGTGSQRIKIFDYRIFLKEEEWEGRVGGEGGGAKHALLHFCTLYLKASESALQAVPAYWDHRTGYGSFCIKDTAKAWGCLFVCWSLLEWPSVFGMVLHISLAGTPSSQALLASQ